MFRDPIVEEVRAIRRQIEEECGNDPEKFYQYILERQEQSGCPLVNRGPKPVSKVADAASGKKAEAVPVKTG